VSTPEGTLTGAQLVSLPSRRVSASLLVWSVVALACVHLFAGPLLWLCRVLSRLAGRGGEAKDRPDFFERQTRFLRKSAFSLYPSFFSYPVIGVVHSRGQNAGHERQLPTLLLLFRLPRLFSHRFLARQEHASFFLRVRLGTRSALYPPSSFP